MVYIVTGGINQGKTTMLLSIYHKIRRGDGLINKKVFMEGTNIGQEIVRLSTGERQYFSFKEGFIPKDWNEECRYGPYSFSEEGFAFARSIVLNTIRDRIEPVFIDELGPLELEGKGFHNIFLMLMKEAKDVYVVIRESCVLMAIKEFSIRNYTILRT